MEGARAAAVIFGDGAEDLTYENLDRAFRLVRGGAELIAMHRNGWWYTEKGETIDTGAFVAAIEYASGVRARLTGKPGPLMFRMAFRALAADVAAAGGPRLRRDEVAMVGDHAPQDIRGAHRAGLRGILVLSGRTTLEEADGLRGAAVPRRSPRPLATSSPRSDDSPWGGPFLPERGPPFPTRRGRSCRLPSNVTPHARMSD